MSRNGTGRDSAEFGRARDELFSHIHRCGVLRSTEEQQTEWMNDTADYLGERFPGLSQADLDELREIGVRFCRPVIAHGAQNTALTKDEVPEEHLDSVPAEEATAA